MTSFNQFKCVPCRGGELVLADTEISKFIRQLADQNWEVIEDHGIKKLTRSFKFKNFAEALELVNKVGELAEAQGHHPEIEFGWAHATVTWWTHKINGLHRNDFIMAAKTDALRA